MPEGQYSGTRTTYEYTSENDVVYLLTLDTTLGDLSEAGLVAATSGTEGVSPPKRFKPRVVFWEGVLGGRKVRKELVCEANSTLYDSATSQALTIDGVEGFTTGKKGEKFTFLKLGAAAVSPEP